MFLKKVLTHKFNLYPIKSDDFTISYGLVDLDLMQMDDYSGMMIMNQNGCNEFNYKIEFVTYETLTYPLNGMQLK